MRTRRVVPLGSVSAAMLMLLAGCAVQPTATAVPAPAGTIAIGTLPKNSDGYADISARQLATLLKEKDFALVNVHIPYEGEIEQTDLFIPFDQIAANLDKLVAKDAPIVLYCRSGSMSTTAARELVRLGYSHVVELDGGFNAWQAAGYPLLNEPQ